LLQTVNGTGRCNISRTFSRSCSVSVYIYIYTAENPGHNAINNERKMSAESCMFLQFPLNVTVKDGTLTIIARCLLRRYIRQQRCMYIINAVSVSHFLSLARAHTHTPSSFRRVNLRPGLMNLRALKHQIHLKH